MMNITQVCLVTILVTVTVALVYIVYDTIKGN